MKNSTVRFTFKKNERITSKKTIAQIIEKGKVLKAFPFYVRFITKKELEPPAIILIAVGKKRFKKAVDRNRIKRLIRETYRLNKHKLHDCLSTKNKKIAIIISYINTTLPDYKEINQAMTKTIEQICQNLSENEK